MRVVVDSGPLIAGFDRRDPAHELCVQLLRRLGRSALVPVPVAVEVEHVLVRAGQGHHAPRLMRTLSRGGHTPVPTSVGLLRRAVAIDARFADLQLGLVDGVVMAIAERENVPVLTFDFRDFRATTAIDGVPWQLLLDERDLPG